MHQVLLMTSWCDVRRLLDAQFVCLSASPTHSSHLPPGARPDESDVASERGALLSAASEIKETSLVPQASRSVSASRRDKHYGNHFCCQRVVRGLDCMNYPVGVRIATCFPVVRRAVGPCGTGGRLLNCGNERSDGVVPMGEGCACEERIWLVVKLRSISRVHPGVASRRPPRDC